MGLIHLLPAEPVHNTFENNSLSGVALRYLAKLGALPAPNPSRTSTGRNTFDATTDPWFVRKGKGKPIGWYSFAALASLGRNPTPSFFA